MFPTGVGMNRHTTPTQLTNLYVPHRRGDEPAVLSLPTQTRLCSPQAWG